MTTIDHDMIKEWAESNTDRAIAIAYLDLSKSYVEAMRQLSERAQEAAHLQAELARHQLAGYEWVHPEKGMQLTIEEPAEFEEAYEVRPVFVRIDNASADPELAKLRAENEALRKGLDAVDALISQSEGVIGLHLNGDTASWQSLQTGGQFEEWLIDFDAALKGESNG